MGRRNEQDRFQGTWTGLLPVPTVEIVRCINEIQSRLGYLRETAVASINFHPLPEGETVLLRLFKTPGVSLLSDRLKGNRGEVSTSSGQCALRWCLQKLHVPGSFAVSGDLWNSRRSFVGEKASYLLNYQERRYNVHLLKNQLVENVNFAVNTFFLFLSRLGSFLQWRIWRFFESKETLLILWRW